MIERFAREFKERWNRNKAQNTLIAIFLALMVVMAGAPTVLHPGLATFGSESQTTGIGPGKVMVNGYRQGDSFTRTVLIYNGHDTTTDFVVSYRYPDWVGTGFTKPPAEATKWVTIYADVVTLNPHEGTNFPITLLIPKGATVPNDKWEFWISVIDQSQEGNIVAELAQRWIVTMQ